MLTQPVIPEINVATLAHYLSSSPNTDVQFVDVREVQEVEIVALERFMVLPLSQFAEWADHIGDRLDPQKETLVLCHHGIRSAQMCQWLMGQGFTNVKNIVGGIDAYARQIDPSLPRY